MTTTIKITTNGSYRSKGTVQIGANDKREISVGPGNMVEETITVPHGERVVLELEEEHVDDSGAGQDNGGEQAGTAAE